VIGPPVYSCTLQAVGRDGNETATRRQREAEGGAISIYMSSIAEVRGVIPFPGRVAMCCNIHLVITTEFRSDGIRSRERES